MDDFLRSRLIEADNGWKEIEISEAVSEGKYNAIIADMEIAESKTGNLILKWEFQIITKGHFFGRKLHLVQGLEGKHAWMAKRSLKTVNAESAESLVELPAVIAKLLEVEVEIEVVKSDKYTNINILRRVEHEVNFDTLKN